jgi:hypothetical protein
MLITKVIKIQVQTMKIAQFYTLLYKTAKKGIYTIFTISQSLAQIKHVMIYTHKNITIFQFSF